MEVKNPKPHGDLWAKLGLSYVNTRYYEVRPLDKSVEQCRSHGVHHATYGWIRQVDPGWSEEQVLAYLEGFGVR